MKYFKCDYCKKDLIGECYIQLKGISGLSGILLPERFHEHDFCSVNCFWNWVSENRPIKK